MGRGRNLPDKKLVTSYSQAAKGYGIPLKCIYQMQSIGVLDARFTVESHDRLRMIIVPMWGNRELLRGQLSKLKIDEKLSLIYPPPSEKMHVRRCFERYRSHYLQKKRGPLRLERVISELQSFHRIVPPADPQRLQVWKEELRKAKQAALMSARRMRETKAEMMADKKERGYAAK